jgi:hypothetical protein
MGVSFFSNSRLLIRVKRNHRGTEKGGDHGGRRIGNMEEKE